MPDSYLIAGRVVLRIHKKEIPATWTGRYRVTRVAGANHTLNFSGTLLYLSGSMPITFTLRDRILPPWRAERDPAVQALVEEQIHRLFDSKIP